MSGSVQQFFLAENHATSHKQEQFYLANITTGAVRCLPFPSLGVLLSLWQAASCLCLVATGSVLAEAA
jgi:hypothetical protein